MHVSFHFTVTDLPFGSVSCLYLGRTRPSDVGGGRGRRGRMPGSVVPAESRLPTHHSGQRMAIARMATLYAFATSGTTSALKIAKNAKNTYGPTLARGRVK